MWRLINIKAENICTFKNLDYSPLQGSTTLIFGNNLDNESQGSNGSGKSALIEAIAIALSGDSLRKVGVEELINDSCESLYIRCELLHIQSEDRFVIERTFSRSSAQIVKVSYNDKPVAQPSVLEYNKYILNVIGISKDDLFSSYILSKYKYSSFLNASDRVKKDLINNFSNGVLVDESIELLKKDMSDIKEDIIKREKIVAGQEGRIASLKEEIELFNTSQAERNNRRLRMIDGHKEAIASQRKVIRTCNETLEECDKTLDLCEELDETFNELENNPDMSLIESYNRLIEISTEKNIKLHQSLKDYPKYSEELHERFDKYSRNVKSLQQQINEVTEAINETTVRYDKHLESLDLLKATNTPTLNSLQTQIKEEGLLATNLKEESERVQQQIVELHKDLFTLKASLAGVIECPACSHKFILSTGESEKDLQTKLTRKENKIKKAEQTVDKIQVDINNVHDNISKNQNIISEITNQINDLANEVSDIRTSLDNSKVQLSSLQTNLALERSYLERAQNQILSLRKSLFDNAFDYLDNIIKETQIKEERCTLQLSTAEANIASFEEAIKTLEQTNVSQELLDLEKRKSDNEHLLQTYKNNLQDAQEDYDVLTQQMARFVDFKTHLANTKIKALGILTNKFLNEIGSDIRIEFSGFTILKSGKAREKISITLLRNGIDCGAFAKFSAGEQCRVNLASILALHELMNSNCDDGKGLDLLILDEILDATDESGLANMFEALNNLSITTMVVSHGQIAEAYPYRLTVTKQNGISTI